MGRIRIGLLHLLKILKGLMSPKRPPRFLSLWMLVETPSPGSPILPAAYAANHYSNNYYFSLIRRSVARIRGVTGILAICAFRSSLTKSIKHLAMSNMTSCKFFSLRVIQCNFDNNSKVIILSKNGFQKY